MRAAGSQQTERVSFVCVFNNQYPQDVSPRLMGVAAFYE
jgi:hypothetical protein